MFERIVRETDPDAEPGISADDSVGTSVREVVLGALAVGVNARGVVCCSCSRCTFKCSLAAHVAGHVPSTWC